MISDIQKTPPFVRLNVHTQYSMLGETAEIPEIVDKAIQCGMSAIAVTDRCNMFGIKEFANYVNKINRGKEGCQKFKPIFGVEIYCAPNSRFDKKEDDKNELLVLLAKNKAGYQNLCKLVSAAWLEGFYHFPRIDKEILEQHSEGLIVYPFDEEIPCEIAGKVEFYSIDSNPVIPKIEIPKEFKNEDDYLLHLTYKRAEQNYNEITEEIRKRIDFELEVIKKLSCAGYFLIVQEIIQAARGLGVFVGTGRGSSGSSIVNYCLGITEIDPLKYDLLFERFLNPDRLTVPDIDIDFDDNGREKVLGWVTEKYGKEKVANIISFGIAQSNNLKKGLKKGIVFGIGIHPCGVVIGADNLENFVPLAKKTTWFSDEEIVITQYDCSLIEEVGLIKLDFLGLKALSVIKKTLSNIKKSEGIDLDISKIPMDDSKTFELYSKGYTNGVFQFESQGVQNFLQELQPDKFEDLIVLNALYRPTARNYIPEYIPEFINRKHGKKEIIYDFPEMESRLKDTCGIYVYQEQIMLLSQDLAGFTPAQSDELRKALGKKHPDKLNEFKTQFIDGATKNGFAPIEKLEKIWQDWCEVSPYLDNKSHAVAYSLISYQTAYLKANFRAEFVDADKCCNKYKIYKMDYNDKFRDLISECIEKDTYIGIGNPDAEILFVGKEGSVENISPDETSTAKKWAEAIEGNRPCFDKYSHTFSGGHTWRKYQKLHDIIFKEESKENEINFGENIFVTEMSEIRKKTTKEAQKESEFRDRLKDRKDTFFKSDFIQQFPVVVLACSDYITNDGESREIDDIFKVESDREYSTLHTKKPYRFSTYYNKDKSKLVIRTRQLSGDVPNELLEMMGDVIRKFRNK